MKRFFKAPICLGIVLIVTALAGCASPLEAPRDAPAQGLGRVAVSIGNGAARTVAPDTAVFTKYTLAFSGPETVESVEVNGSSAEVELPPGTWTITVTAYTGSDGNYAAVAEGSVRFVLSAGETAPAAVALGPKTTAAGTGTFKYAITVPAGAISSLVITTADGEAVEDGTIVLTGGITNSGEKALAPGEYLARALLEQDGEHTGFTEALHIYAGLTSELPELTYTDDDFGAYLVTSADDSGPGTLRQAMSELETVYMGQLVRVIRITLPPGSVITLETPLTATDKSFTLEGNGVTLTPSDSWIAGDESQLLRLLGPTNTKVTIRRVHFKNGLAERYGTAIYNSAAALTLESCIFSGNTTSDSAAALVYSNSRLSLTVRGCTFYRSAAGYAVIYDSGNSNAALTLTGNLFYGGDSSTRITRSVNTLTPKAPIPSHNVVDMPFGIHSNQCGWDQGTGDTLISDLPVLPGNFKLIYGRGAANVLPNPLPAGYPVTDFYGNAISGGGAAGAVQEGAFGGEPYYILDLSVNNDAWGSIEADPEPREEDNLSFYEGNTEIEITATPGSETYIFSHWLVNDVSDMESGSPLTLPLTGHTRVQAVFTAAIQGKTVSIFTDGSDAETTPGTMRYALTNVEEGETITFTGVTPGVTTITLQSPLPPITVGLTIEGNGVTLKPSDSWTISPTSSMLRIGTGTTAIDVTVTIRRVHFKDGQTNSTSTTSTNQGHGSAIRTMGKLTLESCIFSGNQANSTSGAANGGAVYSLNDLTVRGCTFYNNRANSAGGAIYVAASNSPVTLTGNLFYQNTAARYQAMRQNGTQNITATYNVVDFPFGTGNNDCGWTANAGNGTGDTTFADLSISDAPFNTASFVPVAGLGNVIPSRPEDFPATDFYGTNRSFPGAPGAVAEAPIP